MSGKFDISVFSSFLPYNTRLSVDVDNFYAMVSTTGKTYQFNNA